jgi:putative tricarboxylic transport membrane protein
VITVSATAFTGLLVAGFGLVGWLMRQWDYPTAPLVLGLVLGDPMERALRQSLMMSQGDLSILVSRPVSATVLGTAALVLLIPLARRMNAWRMRAVES